MAVRVTCYIIFFFVPFHYLYLQYSRDGVDFIIFSLFPSFSLFVFIIQIHIHSEDSADFWLNFIVSLSNLFIINLNRIYIYKFLYFYNLFLLILMKKNLNFLDLNFLIISNSNSDLKKKTFKYLNYFYLNLFCFFKSLSQKNYLQCLYYIYNQN